MKNNKRLVKCNLYLFILGAVALIVLGIGLRILVGVREVLLVGSAIALFVVASIIIHLYLFYRLVIAVEQHSSP